MTLSNTLLRPLAGAALASLLAACGGGGGSDTPTSSPLALKGTAAVGSAVANASVQVKCLGAVGQTTTAADGSYALQLPGGSLPCVLRVNDGQGRILHSVAQDSGRSTVANITPLTDLLLTRASRMSAFTAFDSYSTNIATSLTEESLSLARRDVIAMLNGTVDASIVQNFARSPLIASPAGQTSSDPHDRLLDRISQRMSSGKLAELAHVLASTGELPDPGPFRPLLSIEADTVTLAPGASLPLVANLNYPPNVYYLRPPVNWVLVEADGGKLSDDGLGNRYTAPSQKGTYHLKAVRDDFVNVSATLTVIVTDFVPVLEVTERAVTVMPGQTHHFSANINYPAGVNYVRQPTRWTVLDAGGGSISVDGSYVAPTQMGTYHVQVQREDFPDKVTTVEVTVAEYQSLERLAGALRAAAPAAERTILRDAESWAGWLKSHQLDTELLPDEVVDFGKHMVVALILPGLSAGCDEVKLLDLSPQGQALQATVQTVLAPAGSICTASIRIPAWLLVTPRSDLPLTVVEK